MPFVRRKRHQVLLVHSVRKSGKVRQEILHTFATARDLARALRDVEWNTWTNRLAWRYPDYRWDWPSLRRDLQRHSDDWSPESPEQATKGVLDQIEEISRTLGTWTVPGDSDLIAAVRPALSALAATLERLIPHPPSPQEARVTTLTEAHDATQEIFDSAMEHWWSGDRGEAAEGYHQVLQLDPLHADSHNHLGIIALDDAEFEVAKRRFTSAVEGGSRSIEADDGHIVWGMIQNRPYLRGMANLALAEARLGNHQRALQLHRELLQLNPSDNQGIRFLVGEDHHRLGDLERARDAYRLGADDGYPGQWFGLALTLLELGQANEAVPALLRGFAGNVYLAPDLLGHSTRRLAGYHGSNLAEPGYATDYGDRNGDLWFAVEGSLELLQSWWSAPMVTRWRGALDACIVQLGDTREIEARRALIARQAELRADSVIEGMVALGRWAPATELDALVQTDDLPPARFPTGDTWITALVHFDGALDSPDVPGPTRRLAAHMGRIAQAGQVWPGGQLLETAIRCRRRPRRRPCPGHIDVVREGDFILWSCTRCSDNGRISDWKSTAWALPEPDSEAWTSAFLNPTAYRGVKELDERSLSADARSVLARPQRYPDGVVLHGAENVLAEILRAAEIDR